MLRKRTHLYAGTAVALPSATTERQVSPLGNPHMVNGFIILSHLNSRQVHRLVGILNKLYGNPPIACHHDESQTQIDRADFPSNVVFVTPTVRTGWGKFSIVEAALAALRALYLNADPDWFTLLSAADYPIAAADKVRSDLIDSGADVLIDYRELGMSGEEANRRFGSGNPTLSHLEVEINSRMITRRYKGAQVWLPVLRRTPRMRVGRHTISLPFDTPFHPFDADFRCYYGDQWFSGSRIAAAALLKPTRQALRLQTFLRRRAVPDECYYQSVLCNRPELKVQRDSRRYARWNGGGAHPALLGREDLDGIMASGAHFARKFAPDDPVLDLIDEMLLTRSPLANGER